MDSKIKILIGVLIIGVILIGIWQAWEEDEKYCNQDSDCKLIYGPCGCEAVSVNSRRTYLDEGDIRCEINSCLAYNATVACVDNQCAVKWPEKSVAVTTANEIEKYVDQEVNIIGVLHCIKSKVPCSIKFDDETSLALNTDISDTGYGDKRVSLIARVYQCKPYDQCYGIILTDVHDIKLANDLGEDSSNKGESITFRISDTVQICTNGLPFSIIKPSGEYVKLKHSSMGIVGSGFDQYCENGKIVSKPVHQLCDFSEKWCHGCSDALTCWNESIHETFTWSQKEYVEITEKCEGKTIRREVEKQVPEGKYQIIVNGKVIKEFTIK